MDQKRILNYTLRVAFALAIALILVQFPFYSLESYTYDLRTRWSPTSPRSGRIQLVAIDRKSTEKYGYEPPALALKDMFVHILKEQPRAILFAGWPFKTAGSYAELSELADVVNSSPRIFFLREYPEKGQEQKLSMPAPFEKFNVLVAPITRDETSFAADNVTRRAILNVEDHNMAHVEIANLINGEKDPHTYRGVFDNRGTPQIYINFHPRGFYKPISMADVTDGQFPVGTLRDKIVIIGQDSESDTDDYIRTPYSKDPIAMSRIEAHANIIDTLLMDDGVKQAPPWLNTLITCAVSIFTAFVVFSMTPTRGVLVLGAMALSFSLLSYFAFAAGRFWIAVTHPLLAIFIPYYFFIPYRLIQEYRKRWEYQQKHALLTQVEELKTNFLSMMSHDLKTPLARIQGMTDVALQHPENLRAEQTEALKTIHRSTEELSLFIGSVLNLSRIESKEIKLHMQSRDINSLLEEVIKKYHYLAHSKDIEIVTELEPLFSVKMDVDLMRQVFSNLVENAIKYSPSGSRILISTEEHENHILVQVADQGVGIPTDELGKVFMKFYRSKEAKSSPVKGSGLGLYLAKYFVELHSGNISVESVPNQGSTFTVDIPMEH